MAKKRKLEYGEAITCPHCGKPGKVRSPDDGGMMVIEHDIRRVDLPGREGGTIPADVVFSACRIYPDGRGEKFGRDHEVRIVEPVDETWENF